MNIQSEFRFCCLAACKHCTVFLFIIIIIIKFFLLKKISIGIIGLMIKITKSNSSRERVEIKNMRHLFLEEKKSKNIINSILS